MVYKYSRKYLVLTGVFSIPCLLLAALAPSWPLRILMILCILPLLFQLVHASMAEFIIDETGLLERSKVRTKYCMKWEDLESISRVNDHTLWILLKGSGRKRYLLRPQIENFEGLAGDLIRYMKAKRIKGIAIRQSVITGLGIDIQLNSNGMIKS